MSGRTLRLITMINGPDSAASALMSISSGAARPVRLGVSRLVLEHFLLLRNYIQQPTETFTKLEALVTMKN